MGTSPIEAYLRSREQGTEDLGPIDSFLEKRTLGERAAGAARHLTAMGEFLQGLQPGHLIENIFTNPEFVASQGVAAPAILQTAVAQPLAALAQLPTGLAGQGFSNRVSDFILRAAQGLYDRTEEAALDAGATPEQIAAAHDMGGFVGYVAPIAASVKTAQFMLRSGQALSSHIVAGSLATDFTAGLIYGGIFTPGEGKDRVQQMALESAAFGVIRLLAMGAIPVVKVWRHRRALELDASGRVSQLLDDIENGRPVQIQEREMTGVLDLLEEENYLMHSVAAQDLLRQNAYDTALLQAIKDLAERRGSGGVFKNAGRTFEEAGARLDRFQTQFPKLKFSAPIRRSVTETVAGKEVTRSSYDIYFGSKGLSNKQLRQLKLEGRFEGQVLQYGDSEVIYVGLGKKAGRIRVRDADGKVKHVAESKLTATPFIKEELDFTPEWDALYKDFSSWIRESTERVAKERGGIPEVDLVEALREGRVTLPEDGRRAFEAGGAIMHPEEIGLAGENAVQMIEFSPMASDMMPDAAGNPTTLIAGITRAVAPERGWRLTVFDAATGQPVTHQAMPRLQDVVEIAEIQGFQIANVVKKYPTGKEVSGLIAQGGLDAGSILDPMPVYSMEDLFDLWASARGLPDDAVDMLAAKSSFGDRLRRELWSEVDEADRAVFDAVRAEQEKLLETTEFPVEALAHMKGFSIERLPEGRIRMREVNTGVGSEFGSELLARKALQKIVRPEVDIPSLIPSGFHGIHAITGGYPVQDLFHFADNIQSMETKLDLPYTWIRNVRDWLIAVENQTGLPLWSQGFDLIDRGKSRFLAEYDPWAKEILSTWKGVPRDRRHAIADFWSDAEARAVDLPTAVKEMQAAGFSAKEINAFRRSRAMFDQWFELSGIERSRYIQMYYTRVRPFVEANGVLDIERAFSGVEMRPAEFQFWAEMSRNGDMAVFEKDPELVMHKYIRGLLWNKHIKPDWDRVAILTGTRTSPELKIQDLPPEMQERIMRNASPGTMPNSAVLPKQIRDVLMEYLNVIRGTPGASLETIRSFSTRFFHTLGIKTDARVLEEFTNTLMSTWYGAAMGLRPSLVARNMTQTTWLLYTRIGNKAMGPGLERAMTQEGFHEALEEGAIRLQEAGIPYGDMIHQEIIRGSAEGTKGPLSMALASAIRKGLRAGEVTRGFSQTTLIPYSSSDQASRAWSYWAQKLHTDDVLARFESGKISWEKFEEKGLPFFAKPVIEKFRLLYDYYGRERALRFIGKMGADETNFIYGVGAQPAWMQSIPGRLLGMFGTWPLWAQELYFRRIRNATMPQAAALVARTLALTGAFANMTLQTGISMWNWIAPGSLFGWSGGPAIEHVINAKQVIDAPTDQKAAAMGRMIEGGLRLSFPGQTFLRDLSVAGEQYDPKKAFLSLMLGRPVDQEHWFMNYQADPTADLSERMVSPETLDSLRIPWLPDPRTRFDFTENAPDPVVSGGTRGSAPLDLLQGNM